MPFTETSGCGREWSCFGGDGAGNYYFNLQVSGILYDGTEIPSQIIPVHVYIYGRSATDLAVMNFGTLSPAWKWNGTSDKPILCDDTADEFEVNWPAGVDGSAVKTDDFIVTAAKPVRQAEDSDPRHRLYRGFLLQGQDCGTGHLSELGFQHRYTPP